MQNLPSFISLPPYSSEGKKRQQSLVTFLRFLNAGFFGGRDSSSWCGSFDMIHLLIRMLTEPQQALSTIAFCLV